MENIDLQEIFWRLGIYSGYGDNPLIWNIFIYVIFIFTLITMLLQGDKALVTTLLSAGGLFCCLIAKLAIFDVDEFGTLIVHAGMFLLPILVAGMTESGKSRGPAILAGIVGAVFFFAFWFVYQFSG